MLKLRLVGVRDSRRVLEPLRGCSCEEALLQPGIPSAVSADYPAAKWKCYMAGGEALPRTFAGLVYTHICESALRGSAEESGAARRGAVRGARCTGRAARCAAALLATVAGWLLIKEPSAAAQRQTHPRERSRVMMTPPGGFESFLSNILRRD